MALKSITALVLGGLLTVTTTAQAKDCPSCQSTEFMQLPILIPTEVTQQSVQGYQQESLVLGLELRAAPPTFVTPLYLPPERLFGAYTREPAFVADIKTTPEFFAAITDQTRQDKGIAFVRKSMAIDRAELVQINRNDVTIYWFKTPDPLDQKAYFLKEGQTGAYQLAGPFSEQFFQTFIGRL